MKEEYKKIVNIGDCSLNYEDLDFHTVNILLAAMLSAFCDEHGPADTLSDTEFHKAVEIIKNLQIEFNKQTM